MLLDQKFECIPILKVLEEYRGNLKSVIEKDEKNNKIKFSGLSFPDNSTPDQVYCREEYNHLLDIMKTLLYIKLGLLKSAGDTLPKKENNPKLWTGIKDGAFSYKNSNLFELNLLSMVKFATAQLDYETGNYQKALRLLNPSNLMEA